MEPVAILTGLVILWAELNNYGIDSEKYPHLKNVRVRRETARLYGVQNRGHNIKTNLQDDSVIMKSITNSIKQNRIKRQSYYNTNNNANVEVKIPLANYPPDSPYYSQNTAGVPYYYNAYNGNNNVYYQNNNNVYNRPNNSGYVNRDSFTGQNYQLNTQGKSENYIMATSGFKLSPNNNNNINQDSKNNLRNYTTFGSSYNQGASNSNSRRFYSPFSGNPNGNNLAVIPLNNNNGTHNNRVIYTNNNNVYNATNNISNTDNNMIHNGNNNTLNNVNNNKDNGKNETVVKVAFMSGIACPEFMKSVTLFGTKVCVDEDYD